MGLPLAGLLFGVPADMRTATAAFQPAVSTSDLHTTVVHDYERERFEQLIGSKLTPGSVRITEAINSIFKQQHLSEDQQKVFFAAAMLSGSFLCLEESIRLITASTNEEGEIIFCGVNHDKSNLTYVRVAYDLEDDDAFLTLSRYEDDRPVFNKYDVWGKVLPQIVQNPLTDLTFSHSLWHTLQS